MRMIFSDDDLDLQRQLRHAFDPQELLNPGKILPATARSEPAVVSPYPEFGPAELVPSDVDQACAMVSRAVLDHEALLPLGNGTRRDFGNFSETEVVPLRTTKLASIVDYDPANQVVVAGAGASLQSLQDTLAQHDQWLPLRPSRNGEHTLGGLTALGLCGPERLRYGAPRDLLLGLKFVSGTGRLITAGGRVVKNVAGYDVTRLMVGSAGTLGLITELTFRLRPLPQRCRGLLARGSLQQCAAAAAKLLSSKLEPNLAVAVPDRPAPEVDGPRPWQLIVGFEGFEETVDFQLGGAETAVVDLGLSDLLRRDYSPRHGICATFLDSLEQAPLILRTDLPPDQVLAFVCASQGTLPTTDVLLDFGCGRMLAGASQLSDEAWERWNRLAQQHQGHVLLEKASRHFTRGRDVFGLPRGDWPLIHRIKAALDPHQVLAPGRLPGKK
jgi:FAD/FMN-containing dehydrogenase